MRDDNRNQTLGLTLLAAGAAAAAGFIGTAHVVRRRGTQLTDHKVRGRVPHDATIDTPHGRAIEQVQKVGKWWVQAPLSAIAAAALWRTGHRRAAGAVALASASSALTSELFDKAIFRRRPPPGHPKQTTPSFRTARRVSGRVGTPTSSNALSTPSGTICRTRPATAPSSIST